MTMTSSLHKLLHVLYDICVRYFGIFHPALHRFHFLMNYLTVPCSPPPPKTTSDIHSHDGYSILFRNSFVRFDFGALKICLGDPSSSITPLSINNTRSPTSRAKPIS